MKNIFLCFVCCMIFVPSVWWLGLNWEYRSHDFSTTYYFERVNDTKTYEPFTHYISYTSQRNYILLFILLTHISLFVWFLWLHKHPKDAEKFIVFIKKCYSSSLVQKTLHWCKEIYRSSFIQNILQWLQNIYQKIWTSPHTKRILNYCKKVIYIIKQSIYTKRIVQYLRVQYIRTKRWIVQKKRWISDTNIASK